MPVSRSSACSPPAHSYSVGTGAAIDATLVTCNSQVNPAPRRSALLAAARHPTAASAPLGRRPARRGDPEHAHRLQPEAELLARGGVGDVAVALQERLERLHEVGLVLLVVDDERLDRLGVEALELARVLAHRGEEQAV